MGRRDLTTTAYIAQSPEPVALLLGAPAVRSLGLDVNEFRDRFGASVVGRPRVPSLVFRFRDRSPNPDAWAMVGPLLDQIGREEIERLTGHRFRESQRRSDSSGGPDAS